MAGGGGARGRPSPPHHDVQTGALEEVAGVAGEANWCTGVIDFAGRLFRVLEGLTGDLGELTCVVEELTAVLEQLTGCRN